MQPIQLGALIGAAAMLLLVGCDNDDVEFGLPGGLRARREGNTDNAACPVPDAADGSVCPDWTTDIYEPMFDGTYGCTLESCHGTSPGGAGLYIPSGDAIAAYDNMAGFENAARPYIGADESYILCNLSPDPDIKIGSLMPLVGGDVEGLIADDDLTAIGNWVLCGSPNMGAPTTGGAGN